MKPEALRHIIWDWNGTLLDDVEACVAAINRMLRARPLPEVDLNRYRDLFGFPVQDYYRNLGFDFAQEDWDSMAQEFHDHYEELSRSSPLYPGAVEALDQLRSDRISMSILSASKTSILDRMVAERGILHYFEGLRGLSNLHAASKVDLGRKLMADLSHTPSEVILVGDTVHDYDVARELGCPCVLIAGGHQSEHRLRRCSCTVLTTLSGLVPLLRGVAHRDPAHV
jgi:phosphoglycolate phosphatase